MRNLLTPLTALATAIVTYAFLAPRNTAAYTPAPPFELDSLVTVAYEEGVYYVETYTHSARHDEDGVYYEDFCDLTDATTGESLVGFVEELTQVASAAEADAYLAAMFAPVNSNTNSKEEPIMQPTVSRNSALPRKRALTDRLLEQRQQYRELGEFFGGGYDGNLAQIDEDLTQLSRLEAPSVAYLNDVQFRIEQRINHRTYDAPLKEDAEWLK